VLGLRPPMRLFWSRRRAAAATGHVADMATARRDALAHAALALADVGRDGSLDAVLRITVDAAARITGAATAVALAADGRLERFVANGLDGCTRDTLARVDVLGALVARLRALARPLAPEDLDPVTAGMLLAVAPHGVVVVPVDVDGLLVLADRTPEGEVDEDGLGVVTLLARLAGAALARAREFASFEVACGELRRLSGQVLARRDEELGRTARELHDGTCQRLAAVNAQLEALGFMLEGQRVPMARLRDARTLVNQAVGELRDLAQQLRPAVLENLGYVEALRWYVGRLRERSGVALSLEVEGAETRLPVEMESALYRATEEALGAASDFEVSRWVRVRYRREPAAVRVQIAGTAPGAVDLVAIRERLRPFGGAVLVTTAPGDAPVIEVRVPTY
jgi:signal transduction histidine kinase